MEISIKDILDSVSALQVLGQQKTRGITAYKISRVIRMINPELETYHKTRISICQTYGELNASKSSYEFKTLEAQTAFEMELQALQMQKIELAITPLSLEDLDHLECSGEDLAVLNWFIVQ